METIIEVLVIILGVIIVGGLFLALGSAVGRFLHEMGEDDD